MEAWIKRWRALGFKRLKLTTIVPVVVGGIVCVEAASLLSSRHGTIEEARYLVARREVKIGQPITSIEFTLARAADLNGKVPPGALTDQDLHLLRGVTTRVALKPGQCLTREGLELPESPEPLAKAVPRGMRAYALDVGDRLDIRAGDRVDILLDPTDDKVPAFPLVEGMLVLRIGREGELAVAASSAQIQILERAKRQGKLAVVLRNPTEEAPRAETARRPSGRRVAKARPAVEVLSEGE